jgi:hypothetical protein
MSLLVTPSRSSRLAAALILVGVLAPHPAPGAEVGCPVPETIEADLGAAGLERSARTARFSTPPPKKLYRKAADRVGEVVTDRDGKKGFGVVVAEVPVEALWRAINDEDAHDEGGFLPINRSEIVGGTPRGTERRVFQAGERLGLGRWWLTRTTMSGALFEASEGRLWESVWEDDMESVDSKRAPVEDPPDLSPIEWSRGAWLLVPLTPECTLVEHFSWSSPGGFVGFMQGLVLGKALTQSVEGMVRMADERYRDPVDGPPFARPDGTPLDSAPDTP